MTATRDAAAAADRRQLAEYLNLHGPTPGPALRDALGWTPARFWAAAHGSADQCFLLTVRGWTVKSSVGTPRCAAGPAAGMSEPPRKRNGGRTRTARHQIAAA